jgi:hypothetical protein
MRNETIFKLAILAGNEMAEKGLSLEDVRANPDLNTVRANPDLNTMPIGVRALFYLLKNQKLSLKGQIKLIEYFGLKWELIILDHTF